MTLEQRIEYLELRDRNTREMLERLGNVVDSLSDCLEVLVAEFDRNKDTLMAPEKEMSR
ncbi:hypothetical protein [Pantoea sp. PGP6]